MNDQKVKSQHYISQFYQKQWGDKDNQYKFYRYDKRWQKGVKAHPVSSNQDDEFYDPIDKHQITENSFSILEDKSSKKITELNNHQDLKIFSLQRQISSIAPFSTPLHTNFPRTVEMRIRISLFVERSIRILEEYIKINKNKGLTLKLDRLTIEIDSLMIDISGFVNTYSANIVRKDFIKSSMGEYWADRIPFIIAVGGILSRIKKNFSGVYQMEDIFAPFFGDSGIKQYPLFTGFFHMIKLTLSLEFTQFSQIGSLKNIFFRISTNLPYQPRDAFSYFLLGTMLDFYFDEITAQELVTHLEKKFCHLKEFLHKSMNHRIAQYLENLKTRVSGKPAPQIHKNHPLSTDPLTFFIPNFELFAKKTSNNVFLPYKAFNLKRDYLHT